MNKTIVLALSVALLVACKQTNVEETPLRSVEVTSPKGSGTVEQKSYSGIIEEAHQTKVGFKTPGQIEKIYVKEGDKVSEGQLLATLDSKDYKLGVEALQRQYDQMQKESERMDQMFAEKAISQNDYEKFNAGMKQLGIQLQVNKNKLEYTRLYAPTAGIILSVNNNPAELVDAGTPIFDLLDVSNMEVVCDIPASQYVDKQNIISYVGKTTYTGDKEMPMKLISLTPKADGNQLYQLRLAFASAVDSHLTAGMNIEVILKTKVQGASQTLSIPIHAVFHRGDNNYVWVLNADSTISSSEIMMTGIDENGDAIISSGINENDVVVRAGANTLQEGEKVKVIEPSSKTNVGGLL